MRLVVDPVWAAELADAIRAAGTAARGAESVFIEPTGGEGSGLVIVGTSDGIIRRNENIRHGAFQC
jgi:hypothetical protein